MCYSLVICAPFFALAMHPEHPARRHASNPRALCLWPLEDSTRPLRSSAIFLPSEPRCERTCEPSQVRHTSSPAAGGQIGNDLCPEDWYLSLLSVQLPGASLRHVAPCSLASLQCFSILAQRVSATNGIKCRKAGCCWVSCLSKHAHLESGRMENRPGDAAACQHGLQLTVQSALSQLQL